MKIFTTRDVLTTGIVEYEDATISNDLAIIGNLSNPTDYFVKNDWFYTRKEAVERAEKVRKTMIKYMEKTLLNLQTLKFEE